MKIHSSPGKRDWEEISLIDLFDMFPDNVTARIWFEKQVWPNGAQCSVEHQAQDNDPSLP